MASGRAIYELGFQISPIILTNGIAQLIPFGMLPIIALTEASDFAISLLQGNVNTNLDNFFAHWRPIPGSTLVDQQIGQYPFANQAVAANAVIANPLRVSMIMHCPMRQAGASTKKSLTMVALKTALETHNTTGGTYTVATPSYIYTNCVMLRMTDVSQGYSKQPQTDFQLDFEQPLVTLSDTEQVLNSLMNKLAGGLPIQGVPAWSGVSTAIGSAMPGLSSANLAGTAVSGIQNAAASIL